jgi:hypothetical protein
MITQDDIQFHHPAVRDHQWAETYWLGLYIPEADIYGWIYLVFRHGTGAVVCDVEFINKPSRHMCDALYVDIQNHIPIPERLDKFTLPNGLTFEATTPSEYKVDYIGIDDTEIHLSLEGIHVPYDIHDPEIDPMARKTTDEAVEHSGFGAAYSNHFDLTMRTRGWVRIRGKRYEVDCLATNDHSWGDRPERGMRMMGYMNAHFDKDYVVQTIWEFDAGKPDGQQHIFKHGYALVDGKLLGGIAAKLHVHHDGIFPKSVDLEFSDVEGTVHKLAGKPRVFNTWVPYGCCPTGHTMLDWTSEGGRKGVGTLMEAYPLDKTTGGYLHDDIRSGFRD